MTERVAQRAAVGGFVGTARYEAGSTGLLAGGIGTTQCVLFQRQRDILQRLVGPLGGNLGGWNLRFATDVQIRYELQDGGGVGRSVTIDTIPWGVGRGRFWLAIARFRNDNNVDLYVHGFTGVAACVGYTPPTGGMNIGNRSAAYDFPFRDGAVAAVWGSDNFLLAAGDRAAYTAEVIDAIEQGRDIPFFRTPVHTEDELWDARDAVVGGGGTRSTWSGRISGTVLTKVGTVNAYSFAGRTP